jgi:CDP-L-myo-inositol myo-inositolphosphotransferase
VATNVLLIVGLAANLSLAGAASAVPLAAWGLTLFLAGLALIASRALRRGGPFSLDLAKDHYRGRPPGSTGARLLTFATIISSRDFFALVFAVLILAGYSLTVLYLFAIAATVWILFIVAWLLPPRELPLAPEDA